MNRSLLWGVRMQTGHAAPGGVLFKGWIGGAPTPPRYQGEPTEPLLFTAKKHALAWCRTRNAEYRTYGDAIVRKWRMRVCRVRRIVEVVE